MESFIETIWTEGRQLYRDMPWRTDTRPYYVLVSELMLQQTQVARVIPKFTAFIDAFPDEAALAQASLADVVTLWQGLGYNRRAKFLHESARLIMGEFGGVFPNEHADILRLPGVGQNTCGAIEAYAFNRPSLFVETNVRTVYIHHFFADDFAVPDAAIMTILKATIDTEHPREFYWALMDYGSWLKVNGVRNVAQSKHYKKQSPLEGSVRQVRGRIIAALTQGGRTDAQLRRDVLADERYAGALSGLITDGLVTVTDQLVHLTK
jgi:A/G-specific adenine glycosylase